MVLLSLLVLSSLLILPLLLVLSVLPSLLILLSLPVLSVLLVLPVLPSLPVLLASLTLAVLFVLPTASAASATGRHITTSAALAPIDVMNEMTTTSWTITGSGVFTKWPKPASRAVPTTSATA